jgi:hypothetical protein
MYNDMHIRSLRQAIEQVKKAESVFKEYCTDVCRKCPVSGMCDWEGHIEYDAPELTDAVLEEYVEYFKAWENNNERQNFYETTGEDPAWYDHNEDRSETWQD